MEIGQNGHSKAGERKLAKGLYITIILVVIVAYGIISLFSGKIASDKTQENSRSYVPAGQQQTAPSQPSGN